MVCRVNSNFAVVVLLESIVGVCCGGGKMILHNFDSRGGAACGSGVVDRSGFM